MHIGIDLGGTKVEIVQLDELLLPIYSKRLPTPQNDYPKTLATIVNLIELAEENAGKAKTIGVGIPGTIVPATNLVKNSNSTCLIGKPFKNDLEAMLGRKISVANDANCFVMSEYSTGAAQNSQSAFGVILGTGVGGGLIHQGCLITGSNGIGGEWGHNCLPSPNEEEKIKIRCYCGLDNCIETYLSGPGFSQRFALTTGRDLSSKAIIELARSNDKQAKLHFKNYCQQLAKSLAQVINIFDPEIIVLGGGMSNIDELYSQVPLYWSQTIFSKQINTKLLKAAHGDSSGVLGAACLFKCEF